MHDRETKLQKLDTDVWKLSIGELNFYIHNKGIGTKQDNTDMLIFDVDPLLETNLFKYVRILLCQTLSITPKSVDIWGKVKNNSKKCSIENLINEYILDPVTLELLSKQLNMELFALNGEIQRYIFDLEPYNKLPIKQNFEELVRINRFSQTFNIKSRKYYELMVFENINESQKFIRALSENLNLFYATRSEDSDLNIDFMELTILNHILIGLLRIENTFFKLQQFEMMSIYSKSIKTVIYNILNIILIDQKHSKKNVYIPQYYIPEDSCDFRELYLEMDNLQKSTLLALHIAKINRAFDYIITPYFGASMAGYILSEVMRRSRNLQIPIIPVKASGKTIRINQHSEIVSNCNLAIIKNKKVLLLDDNSGTGSTLEFYINELKKYEIKNIDTAVVEVAITRINDVIKKIQKNYNCKILWPELLTYKAVAQYKYEEWFQNISKDLAEFGFKI